MYVPDQFVCGFACLFSSVELSVCVFDRSSNTGSFFIRIEFIRILRLKFAKYYEILRINLRLKLRKEYNFAG